MSTYLTTLFLFFYTYHPNVNCTAKYDGTFMLFLTRTTNMNMELILVIQYDL